MKKLFAALLCVAMLVSVFAVNVAADEIVEIQPIAAYTDFEPYSEYSFIGLAIDGIARNAGAPDYNYFKSKDLPAGDGTTVLGSIVFEFDAPYNLSEIWFNMGGCNMTTGKLYGSNTTSDPSSTDGWTEVHSFDYLIFEPVSTNPDEGRQYTESLSYTGGYTYYKVEATSLSKDGGIVILETAFKGVEGDGPAGGAVTPPTSSTEEPVESTEPVESKEPTESKDTTVDAPANNGWLLWVIIGAIVVVAVVVVIVIVSKKKK